MGIQLVTGKISVKSIGWTRKVQAEYEGKYSFFLQISTTILATIIKPVMVAACKYSSTTGV
jgi:hypothetical protein